MTHDELRAFVAPADCLRGKNILVTGAGDGIGKVAALTYAKYGATVLLLGKTVSKLEEVYDAIEAAGGAEPALLPLNLESASDTEMVQLAHLIEKEVGYLDGVLHNAGILGVLTPLEMYDPTLFEKVMRVNFTATFLLTQALLPLLRAAPTASIVFTGSGVGSRPRAFWGAYALSKYALEGMCDIFTQETHTTTQLRFNVINPGATRTQMRASAYPSEDPKTLLAPDDLMAAYVALMADRSRDVKGQVIDLQPKA